MVTVVREDAPPTQSAPALPSERVLELIRTLYDDLAVTVGGLKLMGQAVSSEPRLLELIALTRAAAVGASQHLEAFEQFTHVLQADVLLADAVPPLADS
jgi:hypothetical protein